MKKDLFVSLLPEKSSKFKISFSAIRKPDFFPSDFQKLIDDLNTIKDQVEMEKAAERYLNFLNEQLDDMLKRAREAKKREDVNQRMFFVISLGPVLLEDENGQPVYLASPIGSPKEEDLIPVIFSDIHIATEVDEIRLNPSRHGDAVIKRDEGKILLNDLPLDEAFDIERAVMYYENGYQRVSTMDNFAPIIDSGFEASYTFIDELINLFRPFPDILKQRLSLIERERGDGRMKEHDILGIRKLAERNGGIKFEAIGVNDDSSSFSVANVLDEMKLYLLGDFQKRKVSHAIQRIKENKELKYQIVEQSRSKFTEQPIDARRYAQLNNFLGVRAISKILEANDVEEVKIAYAYVDILHDAKSVRVFSSFNEYELPNSVVAVLENLASALEVIASGPFGVFGYRVNEISVRLVDNKMAYILSYEREKMKEGKIAFTFYYVLTAREQLEKVLEIRGEKTRYLSKIPDIQELAMKSVKDIEEDREKQNNQRSITLEEINGYLMNQRSLVSLSQDLFKDKISPILLKKMLSELLEEEKFSSIKEERFETNRGNGGRGMNGDRTVDDNRRMSLMEELNNYNPSFYQFVIDGYRRKEYPLIKDIYSSEEEQIYDYIEQTFDAYRIALVDAELTAQEWHYMGTELLEHVFNEQTQKMKEEVDKQLRDILKDNFIEKETVGSILKKNAMRRRTLKWFDKTISLNYKYQWQDYLLIRELGNSLHKMSWEEEKTYTLDELLEIISQRGKKVVVELPKFMRR